MSKYLGDYSPTKTVNCKFNTHQADGTPITLAGTPAISVYKAGSTTESTTGVTLTVDYDSITGMHNIAIDTSADGTFYSADSDFDIVITTGTVDSISVVGTIVGSFSLHNRSHLRPTAIDRTLDVATTGEAGLDFNNIKQASGATTLNNITVPTTTSVTNIVTANATQISGDATAANNLEAALDGTGGIVISANIDGSLSGGVGSVGVAGITVSTFAPSTGLQAVRSNTAQAGSSNTITLDASAIATNDYYNGCLISLVSGMGNGQTRLITNYVGSTKVATVDWDWIVNPDNSTSFVISHANQPALTSNLEVSTDIGDPLSAAVPGAYNAGEAGYVLGTNLDAVVSSRLAPTTAGRTLDVTATGEAGLDFDNIKQATGATTLTNITVPTVTAVTNMVTANMTQISGDSTAADNLEAALDGTGGVTISADIDGEVATIAEDGITVGSLSPEAAEGIAIALLDLADGVETSLTVREFLRGAASVLMGKTSGVATSTMTFRDVNDSKDRVAATFDGSNNRTAVGLDLT